MSARLTGSCYALKAEAKPRWKLCRLIKSFQSIAAASLSEMFSPGPSRNATRYLTPHHFPVGLSVILIVNDLVLAFALAAKRLNASMTFVIA